MTGVIYARYSSDNQREESIEGHAEKNDIQIVDAIILTVMTPRITNPFFVRTA